MRKTLIVFTLLSVYFISAALLNGAEIEKEPQLSYSQAIDCLKDLDMAMAYKRLDAITRDFPKSEEAGKSVLFKAVISATEFSSMDMLATRYSQAVQKTKEDKGKIEISKLYMEASQKMVENGKVLVNDVQGLLEYAGGKPMSIEVKKGYNSLDFGSRAFLSVKKLEEGELPTLEEIKTIEDSQKDISYRHVLGKILGDQDLTTEKTIQGEVDWANTMMLMGNWLLHFGGISKAGWLDPATQKTTKSLVQAEKAFSTAKQCFEKARKLSKSQPVKVEAEKRIKELNQILKEFELKKEKK